MYVLILVIKKFHTVDITVNYMCHDYIVGEAEQIIHVPIWWQLAITVLWKSCNKYILENVFRPCAQLKRNL